MSLEGTGLFWFPTSSAPHAPTGRALSGFSRNRNHKPISTDRSGRSADRDQHDAVFDRQRLGVRRSREERHHIRRGASKSEKDSGSDDPADDVEQFAKGSLPLNVKTPFWSIHKEALTVREKMVFDELYGQASTRVELYKMAKPHRHGCRGPHATIPDSDALGPGSVSRLATDLEGPHRLNRQRTASQSNESQFNPEERSRARR